MSLVDRRQALKVLDEGREILAKVIESDETEERGYGLLDPMTPEEAVEHVRMVMRRLRASLTLLEADEEDPPPVRKTKKKR